MDEIDEMLAGLEKQVEHICYFEPSSPVEQKLANALGVLIAIIRKERAPVAADNSTVAVFGAVSRAADGTEA